MKTKTKIRVIRKKELTQKKAPKTDVVDDGRKSARRMVTNVSSWVNDFQKRKRAETKEALEVLFPANPQTDSA
jgi:hypothetical protein